MESTEVMRDYKGKLKDCIGRRNDIDGPEKYRTYHREGGTETTKGKSNCWGVGQIWQGFEDVPEPLKVIGVSLKAIYKLPLLKRSVCMDKSRTRQDHCVKRQECYHNILVLFMPQTTNQSLNGRMWPPMFTLNSDRQCTRIFKFCSLIVILVPVMLWYVTFKNWAALKQNR